MTKESTLKDLKKDYSEIQKKFNLPNFEQLNEDFHIEGMVDTETEYLIRLVRKYMADKLQNYMRFVEMILHPTNASMFIFSIIKTISPEDKEKFSKIYKTLAKYEIDIIELDTMFSEEKEVIFIKNFYDTWQEIKQDMLGIVRVIRENWDKEVEKNKKAYFG